MGLAAILFQFFVEARLKGRSVAIDHKLSHQALDTGLVATNLLAMGALVFMSWPGRQGRRRRLMAVVFMGVALASTAVGAGVLGARWHSGFAAHYDSFFHTGVFRFLETLNSRAERICVLTEKSYPFAGSRRQFLVLQAHTTPAQPQRFRSRQAVLEYLRDHRATIVAIRPGSNVWTEHGVDGWAKQHPGLLTTIWQDAQFTVARIDTQLLTKALARPDVDM